MIRLVAWREDHRTDIEALLPRDHIVVNGVDAARKCAGHTLRADAACQAARRFTLSRLVVVAALHFGKGADALFNGEFGQRDAVLFFDLAAGDAVINFLPRQFDHR